MDFLTCVIQGAPLSVYSRARPHPAARGDFSLRKLASWPEQGLLAAGAGNLFSRSFAEYNFSVPKQVSGPHFLLAIPGEDSQPRLVILSEGETLLGRSQENDIILKDLAVSREHGRVLRQGAAVRYEDLLRQRVRHRAQSTEGCSRASCAGSGPASPRAAPGLR